ncbi:uncharacterized protein LOC116161672 [Photinus pyralis]|nr:uncharacterized protein LOC116161672 [Photinus pyralis]
MAFRSAVQNSLAKRNWGGYRGFMRRTKKEDVPAECANESCPKPAKGFWGSLMSKKKKKERMVPDKGSCRLEQGRGKPDPDLSQFGGTAYRTCGEAYVVEKDNLPSEQWVKSKEDMLVQGIEANLDSKDNHIDPLPHFTSVEQRLIELSDRKLHPSYKRHLNVNKKRMLDYPLSYTYKWHTGPCEPLDIPKHFKYNEELLDQKNIYAHYKRVEPPEQLTARIIEMRRNQKRTLEPAPAVPTVDSPMVKKNRSVYDTLYQKSIKF